MESQDGEFHICFELYIRYTVLPSTGRNVMFHNGLQVLYIKYPCFRLLHRYTLEFQSQFFLGNNVTVC